MTIRHARTYRFATAGQWRECTLHGFEVGTTAALAPLAPFGRNAHRIADAPASAVVVDGHGAVSWRAMSTDGSKVVGLQRLDPWGRPAAPLEIPHPLSSSPRWVADRRWLWAFSSRPATVVRYDAETLEADLDLDLDASVASAAITDIAGDGHQGLWVLVRTAKGIEHLLHVDCDGCIASAWPVPCEAEGAIQIAGSSSARSLLLLSRDGRWVHVLEASSGKLRRSVVVEQLAHGWRATRMAADGRNRVALWRHDGAERPGHPALVLLDGEGDTLDVLKGPLFAASARARGEVAPTPSIADVAPGRNALWLATSHGLWRIDSSEASGARTAESALITPVLESPPTQGRRGWLRAEVDVTLQTGAVLDAQFASTDDPRVAAQVRHLLQDKTLSAQQRQDAAWNLVDVPAARRFVFTAGTDRTGPVTIPLFDAQDRWLWLGLKLVTPAGVEPSKLSALRVRYPDVSIIEQLPAIFRGAEHDPAASMRRLVGVIEATTQQLDERIRSIASNIDPRTAPETWLDVLARWIGLPWDDALPAACKRALLENAGELIASRGTRLGLALLLRCLLSPNGTAVVDDLTVDHAPMRLGGASCAGVTLPALLAGTPSRVATLGAKAVLGSARLRSAPTDCDPLREIVATVRLQVAAPRALRQAVEGPLVRIARQVLPAGVRLSLRWNESTPAADGDGLVLDAEGPGALGTDSRIGRTVLVSRVPGRIDAAGLELGFRLH